jgi:lipoprotein-anchoring transpeptidase ErfK/SrfK
MAAKKIFLALFVLAYVVFLGLEVAAYYVGLRQLKEWKKPPAGILLSEKNLKEIESQEALLKKKFKSQAPKGVYIVVDTGANVLLLKKGEEILKKAIISAGSGDILEEPGGKRTWIFDTPRGEFSVDSKIEDPYWVKPDWAFIEEGEKIPKNPEDRIEAGMLGDYALGFGKGFFIHGTLYTRLLGRNVTHGCVRVGDDDLKVVFKAVSVGTKIFIY